MKYLMILLSIFFETSLWAKSLPERVCGNEYSSSKLIRDWHQDRTIEDCLQENCLPGMHSELEKKKFERIGLKYCAISSCVKLEKSDEIRKCFSQTAPNIFIISTYTKIDNSHQFIEKPFTLTSDDMCYEDCRPLSNKFLSFVTAGSFGLQRESCQKCFKDRDLSSLDLSSFIYPEIGKRLYEGQKCYNICKDPGGDIVTHRKLSLACKQCVGVDGNLSMESHFIKMLNGKCLEVIKNKIENQVASGACSQGNVGYTSLKKKLKRA